MKKSNVLVGTVTMFENGNLAVDGVPYTADEKIMARLEKVKPLGKGILFDLNEDGSIKNFSFNGFRTMEEKAVSQTGEEYTRYIKVIYGTLVNPRVFTDKNGNDNISFSIPVDIRVKQEDGTYADETRWNNCVIWASTGHVEEAKPVFIAESEKKPSVWVTAIGRTTETEEGVKQTTYSVIEYGIINR